MQASRSPTAIYLFNLLNYLLNTSGIRIVQKAKNICWMERRRHTLTTTCWNTVHYNMCWNQYKKSIFKKTTSI